MYAIHCHRCGETSIEASEAHTIECAGEQVTLCARCHDQFRTWFYAGAFQNTDPELTPAKSRA